MKAVLAGIAALLAAGCVVVALAYTTTRSDLCRYELGVRTAEGAHHFKTYSAPRGYSNIFPGLLFAELNATSSTGRARGTEASLIARLPAR